jgi:hypothetical protein
MRVAGALAHHITYRNGEHRNRRLIAAENRHRIARLMALPVKRFEKGH